MDVFRDGLECSRGLASKDEALLVRALEFISKSAGRPMKAGKEEAGIDWEAFLWFMTERKPGDRDWRINSNISFLHREAVAAAMAVAMASTLAIAEGPAVAVAMSTAQPWPWP